MLSFLSRTLFCESKLYIDLALLQVKGCHPGYAGAILWAVSPPLIVGSAIALVPTVLGIALLILRTTLEDQTLRRELDGYGEYAATVKYRLLPGIW